VRLTRSEAAKLRHQVARVDGWLSVATAADLAVGLAWYDRARRAAADMADRYGVSESHVPVECAAGVIAALSPRCQWASNVRAAELMLAAAAAGAPEPVTNGTLANRRKAWRIANGAEPDAVLSGPKVRAFYANIMGDREAVTIDVWAARAAEGRDWPHAPVKRRYRLLAESYRRAGERRGMCPRDVQAAVWTVYRRLHGTTYDPIGVLCPA
jgi:hypothetical protein